MATVHEVRQYLGTLSTILWNYGATFPVPTLDRYDENAIGFAFSAELPGAAAPRPAEIKLAEFWTAEPARRFRRSEYAYDFIDFPRARRRGFHGHDPDYFARAFGVLIHEHCEEALGSPACDHYYGLPIDGFEAIRRFTSLWEREVQLGCSALPCMT
jgi:hypothetical protein